MNRLPGVFAPNGSGVTQPELDRALQNLIVDKVHAESLELQRAGAVLMELGKDMESDDDYVPVDVAEYLNMLETIRDAIEAARFRLSERFEALQRDRERCVADAAATEPLSLSA